MTVTTNEYGQNNLFAREPQMVVNRTTVRVLSPHSSMQRPIMVAGLWWVSSLDLSPMLQPVSSSSASSDDGDCIYGNFNCLPSSARIFCTTTCWNLLMEIPFLKFLLIMSSEEHYLSVLQEYSFWSYSCLLFRILKGVWLDTRIINCMVIHRSTKIQRVIPQNTSYKLAEIIRDTWPQLFYLKTEKSNERKSRTH